MAALYPEETKFFFFVGDGKGRTDFSETLWEHERKKEKYWGDYRIQP
jgi:cell division protein YceG involved in septum cleavage